MIYTNLTVSLSREQATLVVPMVQGDNGRGLKITLSDDVFVEETGVAATDLTAEMWVKKPSGKEVTMKASEILRYQNSDSYQITFDGSSTFANALAETGLARAQVVLKSGNEYVSTFDIIFKVLSSVMNSSSIVSSNEWTTITKLIKDFTTQQELLDGYISTFQHQLQLNVNVRYGTAVPKAEVGDKEGDLYIRIE